MKIKAKIQKFTASLYIPLLDYIKVKIIFAS